MKKSTGYILILLLAITLPSCIREELSRTNHPEYAKLILTPDWSGCNASLPIPESLITDINGETESHEGDSVFINTLFDPGLQSVYLYNKVNNITISEKTATVNSLDGYLDPMPEWFYSSRKSVYVEADNNYIINMPMRQHVNSISLEISADQDNITNIESMTGVLSGVASSLNLSNNTVVGSVGSLKLNFANSGGNKYRSDFRLIGVHPNFVQELLLTVTENSKGVSKTIQKIFSTEFSNFNTNKTDPYSLSVDISQPSYAVEITTDWSKRASGIAKPVDYRIFFGSYLVSPTSDKHYFSIDYRLTAPFCIWNIADGISVSSHTATVESVGEGIINNMPGWMFSYYDVIQLRDKGLQNITIQPVQNIRELNIIVELSKDKLSMIKEINWEWISGIAGSYEMGGGTYSSESKIAPVFKLSNSRFTSQSRILGIIPESSQHIQFTILFKDGSTQSVTKDISAEFSGFNSEDKTSPKTITLNINEDIEEARILNFTSLWDNISEGHSIPASYDVHIGTIAETLTSTTHNFETKQTGYVDVTVFNRPEKIEITDFTATVNTVEGKVDPLPGWFYHFHGNMDIGSEKNGNIEVQMVQHIRELKVVLQSDNNSLSDVKDVTFSLTGVSNKQSITTGILSGGSLSIENSFTFQDQKFVSVNRLLGIMKDEAQLLTINITFTDNTTQTIQREVTELMDLFNANKREPFILITTLNIYTEGEFHAEIEDWEIGDDQELVAH